MAHLDRLQEKLGDVIREAMFNPTPPAWASVSSMLDELARRTFDDADEIRWKTDIVALLGGDGTLEHRFERLTDDQRVKLKLAIWELYHRLRP